MGSGKILVQMESQAWTLEALAQACAEARATGASIVMVKLLPDDYLAWITDDADTYQFSKAETDDISQYASLAASHGVPLNVRVFQYHDLEQGIVKAADDLSADTVYAVVPPSAIPFRHHAPLRHLAHVLHEHHHELHPVDVPLH